LRLNINLTIKLWQARAPIAHLMSNINVNMAALQHFRERQPRNVRASRDVVNELSDEEPVKRYHLNRAGILFVTNLVRASLQCGTKRNHALTAEMEAIITLRFLATGKMQQSSSDDLGVLQTNISGVIIETLNALSKG